MEDAKWVEISFIQGRKILWKKFREISFILWKMHRHSFIQERSIFWRFFSFLWEINLYWKDESLIEKRKIYRRLISLVWKNVGASFIIWKKFLSIFFTRFFSLVWKIFLPILSKLTMYNMILNDNWEQWNMSLLPPGRREHAIAESVVQCSTNNATETAY